MKKIYGFTGYSKDKKIKMVKDYIRSESKNLGGVLRFYLFIFVETDYFKYEWCHLCSSLCWPWG